MFETSLFFSFWSFLCSRLPDIIVKEFVPFRLNTPNGKNSQKYHIIIQLTLLWFVKSVLTQSKRCRQPATTCSKSLCFFFVWSILCDRLPDIMLKKLSSWKLQKHHKNNKFLCLNPIHFFCMYFHQLRTHHAMSLAQITKKDYWKIFGCFRVFFVPFVIALPPFYKESVVFGFKIINFFRHETIFFFRVRWALEEFLSCSNTRLCA